MIKKYVQYSLLFKKQIFIICWLSATCTTTFSGSIAGKQSALANKLGPPPPSLLILPISDQCDLMSVERNSQTKPDNLPQPMYSPVVNLIWNNAVLVVITMGRLKWNEQKIKKKKQFVDGRGSDNLLRKYSD